MTGTTDNTPDEALLAQYPDLADDLETRRRALEEASVLDAETDEIVKHMAARFGDLVAARHTKASRDKAARIRADADADFAKAVESARGAEAIRRETREREEYARRRDATLNETKARIEGGLKAFRDGCHELVTLLGKQGEPEEEIARIMGTTLGHQMNFGVLWTASRMFVR